MIEEFLQGHLPDLTRIRRDLHAHPELLFGEIRTAKIVADELFRLGFEVSTGLAKTGVVGTIRNGSSNRSIGIRADMDALPIQEQSNRPYVSRYAGKMHACGHDGHTTMLLGLARYLSENRNFDGIVHLIFQPSEEDEGGAFRMMEDGLFQRFPCDRLFALHNLPGEPEGQILVKPGPITASCDVLTIVIQGIGGHGALPHRSADPIVAASSLVLALQTIVSRNNDPHEPVVVTVGAINGGSMATVIPAEVKLLVGIRTVSRPAREMVMGRIRDMSNAHVRSFGCTAEVDMGIDSWSYPAGVNTADEAALVRGVALDMGQDPQKVDMRAPFMFSEDFSAMQEVVPSCYFGLGAGPGPMLHDPGYDFNDALLVKGPAFWARLVEKALPQA